MGHTHLVGYTWKYKKHFYFNLLLEFSRFIYSSEKILHHGFEFYSLGVIVILCVIVMINVG